MKIVHNNQIKIKLCFMVFITILSSAQLQAQTLANHDWGHVIPAQSKDKFARVFEGAVHIGPSKDHPSFSTPKKFASINGINSNFLFVEGGIVTENMTYMYANDWDEWPDYVFSKNYKLIGLDELDAYINEHNHLPGVISQEEVKEKGVNDKEMNSTLLKKIEELTLYTIEQHKKLQEQEILNASLLEKFKALEEIVNNLSKDK